MTVVPLFKIVCTAPFGEIWYAVSVGASVFINNEPGTVQGACKSSHNDWQIEINCGDPNNLQNVKNCDIILKTIDKMGDFIYDGTIGDQLLNIVDDANNNRDKLASLMKLVNDNGIEYGGNGDKSQMYTDTGIAIEASPKNHE